MKRRTTATINATTVVSISPRIVLSSIVAIEEILTKFISGVNVKKYPNRIKVIGVTFADVTKPQHFWH